MKSGGEEVKDPETSLPVGKHVQDNNNSKLTTSSHFINPSRRIILLKVGERELRLVRSAHNDKML